MEKYKALDIQGYLLVMLVVLLLTFIPCQTDLILLLSLILGRTVVEYSSNIPSNCMISLCLAMASLDSFWALNVLW